MPIYSVEAIAIVETLLKHFLIFSRIYRLVLDGKSPNVFARIIG